VGIGTTNPNTNYALDVSGSINATGLLINGTALPWTVNGGETFYNGRVGIGNTNPNNNYSLDVSGPVNATSFLLNGTPVVSSPWTLSGGEASFTGRVGIGNSNPNNNYALDVTGTINATNILINGNPISTGGTGGGSSVWSLNGADAFYNVGDVAIGTTTVPAGYSLAVAGEVIAEGVTVALQGNWPDFVFESEYDLPTLEEVENHIAENGHLPNVPSAIQVDEEGIDLGEMNAVLLQKIEELTLYTIQQQKEIKTLKQENSDLTEKLDGLKSLEDRLKALEDMIKKK
jgi:hypothetical protein